MADLLKASAVRDRLHDVVAPYVSATIDRLDAQARELVQGEATLVHPDGRRFACRPVVVVQHQPVMLRVAVLGMPRAVELERFTDVPGLAEVVEDVLAGILAAHGGGAAELAVSAASAQGKRGGFVLLHDLVTGDLDVYLALAGQELGEAVHVGSIVEPQTQTH